MTVSGSAVSAVPLRLTGCHHCSGAGACLQSTVRATSTRPPRRAQMVRPLSALVSVMSDRDGQPCGALVVADGAAAAGVPAARAGAAIPSATASVQECAFTAPPSPSGARSGRDGSYSADQAYKAKAANPAASGGSRLRGVTPLAAVSPR